MRGGALRLHLAPVTHLPATAAQEYAVRKMDGMNVEGSRILVDFAKDKGGGGRAGSSGYRLVVVGLSGRTSWQDLKVPVCARVCGGGTQYCTFVVHEKPSPPPARMQPTGLGPQGGQGDVHGRVRRQIIKRGKRGRCRFASLTPFSAAASLCPSSRAQAPASFLFPFCYFLGVRNTRGHG